MKIEVHVCDEMIKESIQNALEHVRSPQFERSIRDQIGYKIEEITELPFDKLMKLAREMPDLSFTPEYTSIDDIITELVDNTVYQTIADEFKKVS